MSIRVNIEALKPQLGIIVRAIEKGVNDDIRDYLRTSNKMTNNAVRLMRGDNINTNLRNSTISETMELKLFHRSAWEGCLLIDRLHKYTITICTKQTLEGIAAKPNRRIPHYLQTILYAENSDVVAQYHQMHLSDYQMDLITQFTDEDYRDDYDKIMEEEISFDDGYIHLVVVYEVKNFNVTYIAVRLLDRNLDISQEYSLMDYLQPNFGELTQPEEKEEKADAHNLVTVKAGLQKRKDEKSGAEPRIVARKEEREKQA